MLTVLAPLGVGAVGMQGLSCSPMYNKCEQLKDFFIFTPIMKEQISLYLKKGDKSEKTVLYSIRSYKNF